MNKENIRKRIKYTFSAIILAIVGAILYTFFLQDSIEKWKRKIANEPYIAILISVKNNSHDFNIPDDFINGFNDMLQPSSGYFVAKDKKHVTIRFDDDFLDETESSKYIQKYIDDDNCILLVANAHSTLTKSNLELLKVAKNKLSMIMPIATDNTILDKAIADKYNAVLRMLPDNQNQAKIIQKFISQQVKTKYTDLMPRVVIFGDEENPVYSENLVKEITNQIRKNNGFVLDENMIGFSKSALTSIDFLKKADVIVYVGLPHHALLLIDQLSTIDSLNIPLIMTDGCLGASIYQRTGSKYENCYILSPIILREEKKLLGSFNSVGKDTYALCKQILLLSDATRESVYQVIEEAKGKDRLNILGSLKNNNGTSIYKFKFNDIGNNVGWDYSVYSIIDGGLGEKIEIQ